MLQTKFINNAYNETFSWFIQKLFTESNWKRGQNNKKLLVLKQNVKQKAALELNKEDFKVGLSYVKLS